MTELELMRKEQEKIIYDFIQEMNQWLEAFNNYSDNLIKNYEESERLLRELMRDKK